jgi:hypothetical protein
MERKVVKWCSKITTLRILMAECQLVPAREGSDLVVAVETTHTVPELLQEDQVGELFKNQFSGLHFWILAQPMPCEPPKKSQVAHTPPPTTHTHEYPAFTRLPASLRGDYCNFKSGLYWRVSDSWSRVGCGQEHARMGNLGRQSRQENRQATLKSTLK